MKRRKMLAVTGGSITALGLGITQMGAADATKANVTMGELAIPDFKKIVHSKVTDVDLSVQANYSWDGNTKPDGWALILSAGHRRGQYYTVDSKRSSEPIEESGSGSMTLSGSLVDTPAFSLNSFHVGEGQTRLRSLYTQLKFKVLKDGKPLATAVAKDSSTMQVTNKTITVKSQVGGRGNVSVVTD